MPAYWSSSPILHSPAREDDAAVAPVELRLTVDPFVKTPRRFILAAEIRLDPRLRGSVSAPPRYPSPQPYLWSLDDLEWHTVMPLPPYRARQATRVADEQARLFP
jgi:hypothetical protein